MQTSPDIHELITALALARQQFPAISRNKTVAVKSERGAYTFNYATLDSILDAVCPVLGAHGLAILCGVAAEDGVVRVTTRLAHKSGQWVEDAIALPRPAKVQELGSLITYAKRYAINALLGIEGETDDDGNAADGNAVEVVRPAEASPAVTPAGDAAAPAPVTGDNISTLLELAHSVGVDLQAFGHDMRRVMGLAEGTRVTKKLLRERLTRPQYQAAWEAYSARLRQEVEQSLAEDEDVPEHVPPAPATATAPVEAPANGQPTAELTPEQRMAWGKLSRKALAVGLSPTVWESLRQAGDYRVAETMIVALEGNGAA
jgi:ERF superfamily protein